MKHQTATLSRATPWTELRNDDQRIEFLRIHSNPETGCIAPAIAKEFIAVIEQNILLKRQLLTTHQALRNAVSPSFECSHGIDINQPCPHDGCECSNIREALNFNNPIFVRSSKASIRTYLQNTAIDFFRDPDNSDTVTEALTKIMHLGIIKSFRITYPKNNPTTLHVDITIHNHPRQRMSWSFTF